MKAKKTKLTRRDFLKNTGALVGGAMVSGSVLASCVPQQAMAPTAAPVAATPETAAATQEAVAAAGAKVESVQPITVLINDSPWFPGFEKLVGLYEEQTGNKVNLDVTPFPGMLEKTTNATTAAESEYDIVNLNEGWYATFYAGKFMTPITDIDPNFELDPQVIEYDSATRWNHEKNYSTSDGILYGLPINGNIQLFYYRADLYEQAGLKPPETWDDVQAAAEKYTDAPNFYGFVVRGQKAGFSVTYNFLPYLRGYGGDVFANPPDDFTVTINSEAGKKALNKYLELANKYGPPNQADVGQSEMLQLLITNKVLQDVMVVAAWPSMDDPEKSLVVDKVNVTVVPKPADGEHATTSGIWVMGIPQNLPDARKQAGLTFLKWALTKDAQMEYTKFGAVPVRQDVYESDLGEDPKFRWMKAMAASTPYIRASIRIPEGPQILESTELRLNQAVAGQMSAEEALDTMAKEIFDVMQKAGYKTAML
jgi:multiple sugar transport system substrate-binding protein